MIKKTFVFVALLAGITSAMAGGSQTGPVSNVIVKASDNLVYVYIDGPMVDKPSCSTGYYWVIKDENSATGKKQLALLLAAQMSNRKVNLTGMGTCSRWRDGEDIDAVNVMSN